jgi:tetratricopeptide (TPR) repeat protein
LRRQAGSGPIEYDRWVGMPGLTGRRRGHRGPGGLRARRRGSLGLVAAAGLLWLGGIAILAQPGSALAQTGGAPTQPNSELEEKANALFQQLMKNPTNVELNFRYAQAAAKIGNYEGAISALERLLLYNPNYPGVKLELADLYIRLSSYDAARAYLDQAEKAPGVSAETRARIRQLRARIERATAKSKFAVDVIVGLRHQSDASAEPAGSDILAGGVPLTLSAVSVHKPGWDAFVGSTVHHTYELGAATWESNALIYSSKQFRFGSIDSSAVELNSGPRFDVGGADSKLFSVRPYALANEVLLGNSQFLWTGGAGVEIDGAITQQASAAGFYEFRSEQFSDVTLVPTATDMTGGVHALGTTLSYAVSDDKSLGFEASYAIDDARTPTASNHQLVLRASYTQVVPVPSQIAAGPLVLTPFLYWIHSRSDGPIPGTAPELVPSSHEWRAGINGELQLTDTIAATMNVVREISSANLAANRFNDTQVIFGMHLSY